MAQLTYMNWAPKLKIAAGTATVIGIVLGLLDRVFAPHALLAESSPDYPAWLGWLGFIVASVAALSYIIVDLAGRAGGE